MTIKDDIYWTIVCGSYLGYHNSYAHDANMRPAPEGGVACVLYPDGKYKGEMTS